MSYQILDCYERTLLRDQSSNLSQLDLSHTHKLLSDGKAILRIGFPPMLCKGK